jgi:hypothetical protein
MYGERLGNRYSVPLCLASLAHLQYTSPHHHTAGPKVTSRKDSRLVPEQRAAATRVRRVVDFGSQDAATIHDSRFQEPTERHDSA